MKTKNLGRTGLQITAVGLGCGNFGGVGSAPAFFGRGETEAEAHALMDMAWGSMASLAAVAGGKSVFDRVGRRR